MFNIHDKYNFSPLSTAVLGASFSKMKVLKTYGYDDAIKDRGDIPTTNTAVFSDIGVAIPDPKTLTYIAFEVSGEAPLVLATAWISLSTVVASTSSNVMSITITDVSDSESLRIVQALRALNFNNITYTIN